MLHDIWNAVLYKPLLNALALLVSIVPGGDVGVAVILLTILVKLILFPLSQRAIENQAAMNMLAPELDKIKKSGVSKEEQARLTLELYKKHRTNPFSGCLLQIPAIIIIIALYRVFITGVNFEIGTLYFFVQVPEHVNMVFLGLIDISQKSLVLAILAGITQYFQAHFMPKPPVPSPGPKDSPSFQNSFTQSMNMQMKYFFPFLVAFFAYYISGAVALYLIANNIFTIGQQIYANKKEKRALPQEIKEEMKVLNPKK